MTTDSSIMENVDGYNSVIEKIGGDLPSISVMVNKMVKIASDPESENSKLCSLISNDQSVFSKILKIANSVEYRQGNLHRISEANEAVLRIGSEKVRRIILSSSVLDVFASNDDEFTFKLEGLWLHSCAVAIGTEVLAKKFQSEYSDQAYACGLLHDLGKVAKIQSLKDEFVKEVKFTQKNNCTLWFAEKALDQIHHDVLGCMILKKWSISPIIEQTTRWHHTFSKGARQNVEDPAIHKLIDITILSNHLVKELRFGSSGSAKIDELPDNFLRRNRIDDSAYQDSLELVRMHIDAESENLAILLKD
mgnify:CR=1 FL=1